MSRHNNKHRTRSFLILIAVVLVMGLALWQTENLVNPFQYSKIMMNTAPMPDPAEASPEEVGFTMVSLDDIDATNAEEAMPALPDGGERPDHEAVTGWQQYVKFAWDDIGGVFYNLWMILALTVGVIVVARPIGWIIKTMKKFTKHQSAANPA